MNYVTLVLTNKFFMFRLRCFYNKCTKWNINKIDLQMHSMIYKKGGEAGANREISLIWKKSKLMKHCSWLRSVLRAFLKMVSVPHFKRCHLQLHNGIIYASNFLITLFLKSKLFKYHLFHALADDDPTLADPTHFVNVTNINHLWCVLVVSLSMLVRLNGHKSF